MADVDLASDLFLGDAVVGKVEEPWKTSQRVICYLTSDRSLTLILHCLAEGRGELLSSLGTIVEGGHVNGPELAPFDDLLRLGDGLEDERFCACGAWHGGRLMEYRRVWWKEKLPKSRWYSFSTVLSDLARFPRTPAPSPPAPITAAAVVLPSLPFLLPLPFGRSTGKATPPKTFPALIDIIMSRMKPP